MQLARLDVRLAGLSFEDKSATGNQSSIYALEKPPQASVATIQMNPLRYRKPAKTKKRPSLINCVPFRLAGGEISGKLTQG